MVHWNAKTDIPDLTGKVAIVTGGNTGIGKETVRYLALNGAKVYMASRTESRALGAIEDIIKVNPEIANKGGIHFLKLDLMDLKSCQNAARDFLSKESRLDILVNNAGIMATEYHLTNDGIEEQFQTNHLGHFAFTYPLLPTLVQTSKLPDTSVRIVQVSSYGHNFATDQVKFDSAESVNRDFGGRMNRYGQSKLANILFAKEIQRRYAEERIWSSAVHPGLVETELGRGIFATYPWAEWLLSPMKLIAATPFKGARTSLYTATSPDIETKNWRGEYFIPPTKRTDPSKLAQNEQLAKDLWALSEQLVREKCGGLE